MQNKQIMIMKQMKRASKKGKTLTINKIPSSDDFRMNFRRLKVIAFCKDISPCCAFVTLQN